MQIRVEWGGVRIMMEYKGKMRVCGEVRKG
jgi:hypothetical protein